MTKRRVVITGMGAVTPIGKNINDFWAAIRAGKCGVGPITLFDASNCPVKIAAEVKDFKPEEHDIDPKEARRMARFTQFLLAASKEAVADASLTPEDLAQDTTGIVAGTGLGGMDIIDSTYTQYTQTSLSRSASRVRPTRSAPPAPRAPTPSVSPSTLSARVAWTSALPAVPKAALPITASRASPACTP